MSVYEFINPSDALTFEGNDDNVAAAAALILGQGQAGLRPLDGDTEREVLPLMLLWGDGEFETWLEKRGIGDFSEFADKHRNEIVAFLRSVVYGDERDRRAFDVMISETAPERLQIVRDKWNDARRSSLTDWATAALKTAERLETDKS